MLNEKVEKPALLLGQIIRLARLCSFLVGADVTDPNFHFNWVTAVMLSSIIGYFIFTATTIIKVKEWTFMLEALAMIGSVLQGIGKMSTAFIFRQELSAMRKILEDLYEEYQQKGPDYCKVLIASCRRQRKVIKSFAVVYFLSVFCTVAIPILVAIATRERVLIMHFQLPGLDVTTNFGYGATLCAHCLCMFCGGFGLFAGDLFVLIYLTQGVLFVDILRLKTGELNSSAHGDRKRHQTLLKDIIKWHQFYTE